VPLPCSELLKLKSEILRQSRKVFIFYSISTHISVIYKLCKTRDANNNLKLVRIFIQSYAYQMQTLNIISTSIKPMPYQSLCAINLNKLSLLLKLLVVSGKNCEYLKQAPQNKTRTVHNFIGQGVPAELSFPIRYGAHPCTLLSAKHTHKNKTSRFVHI
jgi:hypothetical protein